jgi:hypothetical protein
MTPSYKPLSGDEEQAYKSARERAEAIQGLYIHLLVFMVINAGLFGINWFTRGDDGGWWFYWALLGWGIGLLVHVLVVIAPVFSPEWVDRRAQRIMANRP